MPIQRLPQVGLDEDTWGTILNGFLEVSHNADGTEKTSALSKALGSDITTGTDDTKYVTSKAINDAGLGSAISERLLGSATTSSTPSGDAVTGDYYEALTTGTYTNFGGITATAGNKIKKTVSGTWYAELAKAAKLDVFGVNVYDKTQNESGKFIAAGSVYTTTANATYYITGFIPIDNVNVFSLYNLGNIGSSPRWAYFTDANNASFISAFQLSSNTQPNLVNVPSNAKYVKASLHYLVIDTFKIINEGLSKIDDNRGYIDSFTSIIASVNESMDQLIIDTNVKNPLSYNIPPFIKSSNGVDSEFDASTVGALDYYAAYDKLMMIFSWYIKKTVIGTSQTPEGTYAVKDSTVYNINCYEFSALNLASDAPKIILSAGIHGDSEGTGWYNNGGDKPQSIISLFYFLKNLCYNPNSNYFMQYLRENVRILVVPVMNPWGVTNHSRANGRNIDLNRNFDINFVANQLSYASYSGAYAFSESETLAWKTLVENNLDAKFIIESHSRGADLISGDYRYHMMHPVDTVIQDTVTEVQLYMKKTYGGYYSSGTYSAETAVSSQINWAFFIKGIPAIEPEHFGSMANDATTLNSLETNMMNAAYQAIIIQRFTAKYILGI